MSTIITSLLLSNAIIAGYGLDTPGVEGCEEGFIVEFLGDSEGLRDKSDKTLRPLQLYEIESSIQQYPNNRATPHPLQYTSTTE